MSLRRLKLEEKEDVEMAHAASAVLNDESRMFKENSHPLLPGRRMGK